MTGGRILVAGLGSSGLRHVAALGELGREAAVLTGRQETGDVPGPVFASREEADEWGPEAVVVCTETARHLDDCRWALEGGRHVLVEKPLAVSTAGVDVLIETAEREELCLAVGYNLRFHPAIEAIRDAIEGGSAGRLLAARLEVGQYLPDWHPERDYRSSYVGRAEAGGGALLTLSHEIDLALWVCGPQSSVTGIARRASDLEIDVDDLTELVIEHRSGAVSSVHLDLLDRSYNRRSRWVGSEATIEWRWGGPVTLRGGGEEVLWDDPGFRIEETAIRQLDDFLVAVEVGGSPRTSGRDGAAVLEVCAAVRSST